MYIVIEASHCCYCTANNNNLGKNEEKVACTMGENNGYYLLYVFSVQLRLLSMLYIWVLHHYVSVLIYIIKMYISTHMCMYVLLNRQTLFTLFPVDIG